MNIDFLNFIAALAIIITVAKVSGLISIRLGQPSVLGELVAGLILGPTVLNMLDAWPRFAADGHLSESITLMAEVGVLLLMFLAGLNLELSELLKSGRVSALAGSLGVFLPLLGGYFTARLFGIGQIEAVFIGLALSATSVSISAQTLMELGVLRSRVGLGMLGAAIFDDILVVLLLSIATVVIANGTTGGESILDVVLRMTIYITLAVAIGLFVLPRLLTLVRNLPISEGVIAFTVVTVLVYGWSAESLGGMASITGAFLAGLFFARTSLGNEIESGISTLAYSFFVPIFFVNIGLHANLRAISGQAWYLAITLTIVAIVSKIVGSGAGALWGGFDRKDALRLGIGMVSRGEVGLIVAAVALGQLLINQETFTEIVFMVIVATLVTPIMLRAVYKWPVPQAA
ncbi:MAG: cation:proton antiporter [Chloroflexota bacterium]|jgi:Kef-type K+ transport system membrane component KefB